MPYLFFYRCTTVKGYDATKGINMIKSNNNEGKAKQMVVPATYDTMSKESTSGAAEVLG